MDVMLSIDYCLGPTVEERRKADREGVVLGPRSGGTTGAALGQGLGLSSMAPGSGNNQSLADLSEWP